ncbi:PREDICTED: von Willebrand factor A domain-containing protein 7-like [Cyprinodon variegatus]|uniref:von Willebrand factor A domain-containing protein 7-like n=1 Tax=Cyprinodon variegatus TaxID=28743 RepID=A0A3Q2CAQ8_CYPVA|nr:PREDICTED: von Willebrand factor A domain-containing protein 7-like [Cyprinodon variegatus]XP_015251675.1 PREDICTED: von Willebrand factor A domain-containing protein 7-like [Cyprinodon variegatus]
MALLLGVTLLALTLSAPAMAFFPIGGGVSTHVSITGTALLQKITETCKAVAEAAGHEFKPTGSSPGELVQACLGPTAPGDVSGAKFQSALQEIYTQNGLVDRDFVNSAPHHFNSEAFLEGRGLITEGMVAIKANIGKENFKAARETLGRVLHTLQDFYSHSNWVELGNTEPYINLIRPDLPLENLADVNTPTCSDCSSGTCSNQILSNILKEKKLTSGYMGIFSSEKPKGKCSHGGASDFTSTVVPRGSISKDERRPHNQALHDAAVNVAISASLQLLDNIRLAAGDHDFLRMMGIARSSVVCFVIDTTGSMSDDIEEARSVVYDLIDSKKGTQDEPSEYILVPFNDPDFGPMIRTTDPNKMKTEISKLRAQGGGDTPEMCLSGLQLALTGAPSSSNIYVFTDAIAKDIALKDTIVALMRSTKSVVSFFMTATGSRKRRSLAAASFEDYKDLALASGGQAIRVSKSELPQATDIVLDTSTSALVTVLQRARIAGGQETFPYLLDQSLKNITIYITGTSLTFTLTNPAGATQSNSETSGKLGTIQTVGNLWRIRLNADTQSGTWKIEIKSSQPYTLKVTGQSTITFVYDFVEKFTGPHSGYAVLSGRPQEGQPATLMLSVIGRKGPSSITVEEAGLITLSSSEAVTNGAMTDMGNGDFLVTVDAVPEGEFVLFLKGTDKLSNTKFQRQSTTQMSVSKVIIQAAVDRSAEPGEAFKLPFSIMSMGAGGKYTINARNDRDFPMTYPNSLSLSTGQYVNSTLTITPSSDTESGTDVTLTIEAKSESGVDSNYAVLRLSVITKITDFIPPKCEMSVLADNCPKDVSQCGPFRWELSANLTDGNGSGIKSVSLNQGNGTFTHTTLDASVVNAYYNASCCSQIVEIVAVDEVGNVGTCYHSIIRSAGFPATTLSMPVWLCFLVSVFVVRF